MEDPMYKALPSGARHFPAEYQEELDGYMLMTAVVRIFRRYIRGEITLVEKSDEINRLDKIYGIAAVNAKTDRLNKALDFALDEGCWD